MDNEVDINNDEIDINSVDAAMDEVADLIEGENKTPAEAIAIVLEKFNVSKDDLLKEFELVFLCKPEEYQNDEMNWASDDIGSEIEMLDAYDDIGEDLASILG